MTESKTCNGCSKSLNDSTAYSYTLTDPPVYTCDECRDTADLNAFKEKGELTDRLILKATMAWLKFGGGENDRAATSWFLQPEDRAVKLVDGKFVGYDVRHAPPEMIERARTMLEVWKTPLGDVFRDYIAVRDEFAKFSQAYSNSIRKYWNSAESRGHTADCGEFKVLLWGCAGRIIFTIEGVDSKYRGANVNGIMSDDEKDAINAGLNGMSATKNEAIALLQAAMAVDLKFVADDGVAPIPVHVMRAQQEADKTG